MADALAKYEGRSFCARCTQRARGRLAVPDWRRARRGRYVLCGACGARFPCPTPCEHIDCADARAELGAGRST